MAKKIYVIDTCVLLHDPQAVYQFQEHDLYIPLAVIDDLDEIKTRPAIIGFYAREAFRILDKLALPDMMNPKKGAKLNDKGGKIFIFNGERPLQDGESPNIVRVNSDNAIINTAISLKSKYPNRAVVIVTLDKGLQIRAEAWGCLAEKYRNDMIPDSYFDGFRTVQINNDADWKIVQNPTTQFNVDGALSSELQLQLANLSPNEFVIFDYGKFQCPTIYQSGRINVIRDKSSGTGRGKPEFMGVEPKNLEQRCAMQVLSDPNIPLVTLLGSAGTGKTLISLAVGLEMINRGVYDKIIIIKPIIPVGGKDLGALPGDKYEKLFAWLGPMRDNIEQLIMKDKGGSVSGGSFEELHKEGIIEVEAMTYIQGRSIPNAYILIDESQNLTPREARMVVERCGKNSKVVLLGDLSQVENTYLDARSNGLAHAVSGGKNQPTCATATLQKVERSELAAIASTIFKDSFR